MVCRKVQVARPRASTSAGQLSRDVVAAAAAIVAPVAAVVLDWARWDFDHVLKELHTLHGFPSGPSMTPGGRVLAVFGAGSPGDGTGMVVREQKVRVHSAGALTNKENE